MKLFAKLPPDDEGANLMRVEKRPRPTGVRMLLGGGRWHGRREGQEDGRVAMHHQIRQRISTADDYVSAWLQDAVSSGGGT